MTEEEARKKIQSVLDKVHTSARTITAHDDASVNYHIDQILKAGGGRWDNKVAELYITTLQSEVDEELTDVSAAVLDKHKEDVTY